MHSVNECIVILCIEHGHGTHSWLHACRSIVSECLAKLSQRKCNSRCMHDRFAMHMVLQVSIGLLEMPSSQGVLLLLTGMPNQLATIACKALISIQVGLALLMDLLHVEHVDVV